MLLQWNTHTALNNQVPSYTCDLLHKVHHITNPSSMQDHLLLHVPHLKWSTMERGTCQELHLYCGIVFHWLLGIAPPHKFPSLDSRLCYSVSILLSLHWIQTFMASATASISVKHFSARFWILALHK